MNDTGIRRALLVAFSGLLAAGAAAPARAQAWLPPKGEAWLSLGYGDTFSKAHYLGVVDSDGTNQEDVGHTRVHSIGLATGYGITDRLALAFGIPFIAGKYMGPRPHRYSNGAISTDDDGSYHGTFQDYRINLAYRLVNGSVAVSPFFTAVIPSHSYTYFSHAAPGRHLHEYLLGFSVGSRLDGILPGSYAEVTYAYAFVEKVQVIDVNLDRSYFDAQVGYFLTPSLALRILGSGYYTHGGLVFRNPSPAYLSPALFPYHDQIGKSSIVQVGGGLSYSLTGSTEVSASYSRSVYGRSVHKLDTGLSFGVTYSFSPTQLVRRYFSKKSAGASAEER